MDFGQVRTVPFTKLDIARRVNTHREVVATGKGNAIDRLAFNEPKTPIRRVHRVLYALSARRRARSSRIQPTAAHLQLRELGQRP